MKVLQPAVWISTKKSRAVLTQDASYDLNKGYVGDHTYEREDGSPFARLKGDILTIYEGFEWDLCSPSFRIFNRWVGTPTSRREVDASLVHDCTRAIMLLECAPFKRKDTDDFFWDLLKKHRSFVTRTYHFAVASPIGSLFMRLTRKKPKHKCSCEIDKMLKWRPDLPDVRDVPYKTVMEELPPKVDLRPMCSTIEDQGKLGSCTGQALAGALELLQRKRGGRLVELSRLFIYFNEREMIGTINQDSGAYLRDGIKSLARHGVCQEKLWPHITRHFRRRPPRKCYVDAAHRKIVSYKRLTCFDDMKDCLASGHPFVFGFTVYDNIHSAKTKNQGILDLPGPGQRTHGGHAVMAVGYDDETQRFIVRNSWGTQWGDEGYFTMPYEYLTTPNLARDFWAVYA